MIRAALAATLALTCGGCADPVLDPFRDALADWDSAREARALGQLDEALGHVQRARERDPRSPALWLMEADILVELGREGDALLALEQGLRAAPGSVDLRYNLAALLSRTGDLERAAAHAQRLVGSGAVTPAELGMDADFAALAGAPEHRGLVVLPRLELTGEAPGGTVLLGDSWSVEFTLTAPTDAPIVPKFAADQAGLLSLEEAVEDVLASEDGRVTRRLRFTWRAVRPGKARFGPLVFSSDGREALSPVSPIEVIALGDRTAEGAPAPPMDQLPAPGALLPGPAAPAFGRWSGRHLVHVLPGMTVSPRPPGTVRLELRRGGQTERIGWWMPLEAEPPFTVRQGSRLLLEGPAG